MADPFNRGVRRRLASGLAALTLPLLAVGVVALGFLARRLRK